jgi:hypothetical protein
MALPGKNDKPALAEIKMEFWEMAQNYFGEIRWTREMKILTLET